MQISPDAASLVAIARAMAKASPAGPKPPQSAAADLQRTAALKSEPAATAARNPKLPDPGQLDTSPSPSPLQPRGSLLDISV